MQFEYYYGSEAEQFSFIRIPKVMLVEKCFAELSISAKILYGLLLDRMSLSVKNGWLDEEKRVYIIFKIEEIMEMLGFSKKKAIELLNELENFGLVEKRRRGLGLPSILYVKSFMSVVGKKGTSRGVEMGTSGGVENALQEVPKMTLQEVSESTPQNNTNINNTYLSDKKSYHILSPDRDGLDEMNAYAEIIRENIEYEILKLDNPLDLELLEGIYGLILETVISKSPTTVIASNTYPTELVKSKFLKFNSSHIRYVLDCLQHNTSKVKNIKKYMLAALFNAPCTIDGYYQAEVNHDLYGY